MFTHTIVKVFTAKACLLAKGKSLTQGDSIRNGSFRILDSFQLTSLEKWFCLEKTDTFYPENHTHFI